MLVSGGVAESTDVSKPHHLHPFTLSFQQFGVPVALKLRWQLYTLMRVRILCTPPLASIDGIQVDGFEVGAEYDVGNSMGALFLAEGWAEPTALDQVAPPPPLGPHDPFVTPPLDPARKSSTSPSLLIGPSLRSATVRDAPRNRTRKRRRRSQ